VSPGDPQEPIRIGGNPAPAQPDVPADAPGHSERARHARSHEPKSPGTGRKVARVIGAVLTAVILLGSFWAGWTFQRTYAESNGEPTAVLVATWMRDNNMGTIVAQLENVYYRYINKAEVGGEPTLSADVTAEDNAGVDAADLEPTPTATASTRPHLSPPDPIKSPVKNPEPKEGEWQPVASRVDGIPAVYVTRVRADDVHTSYYASVMWIDTLLTKAMFVPGYQEPAGGPNPYNGALPEKFWPDVLANWNGAFRLEDSQGGYYFKGKEVAPLVDGKASAVFNKDGSLEIGKWGRDLRMNKDVDVVRQNLNLIVDNGKSMVKDTTDGYYWGATTDGESLAWRAAVGQREDGSIVYIGSPYLSASGLADTLVGAGVQRAMVLDMNNWWTAGFYFRHTKDGAPLCRKLDPAIEEGCDRFLKPYKRDSFQILANNDPTTEGTS